MVGQHEVERNSVYYSIFTLKIASFRRNDAVFELVAHGESERPITVLPRKAYYS